MQRHSIGGGNPGIPWHKHGPLAPHWMIRKLKSKWLVSSLTAAQKTSTEKSYIFPPWGGRVYQSSFVGWEQEAPGLEQKGGLGVPWGAFLAVGPKIWPTETLSTPPGGAHSHRRQVNLWLQPPLCVSLQKSKLCPLKVPTCSNQQTKQNTCLLIPQKGT